MNLDDKTMLAIYRKAEDDLGIFPMSVTKNGVTTPRDKYGEGWNDALETISKNRIKIIDWFKTIPEDTRTMITTLMSKDYLELSMQEDGIKMWTVLNDTFSYACADGESVEMNEIPVFYEMSEKYGYDGIVAWASNKTGATPISPLITAEYNNALKELKKEKV